MTPAVRGENRSMRYVSVKPLPAGCASAPPEQTLYPPKGLRRRRGAWSFELSGCACGEFSTRTTFYPCRSASVTLCCIRAWRESSLIVITHVRAGPVGPDFRSVMTLSSPSMFRAAVCVPVTWSPRISGRRRPAARRFPDSATTQSGVSGRRRRPRCAGRAARRAQSAVQTSD
jgi:hypothetical protein